MFNLVKSEQNEIQSFSNELFGQVRILNLNGKPYAMAKDVALALGYQNTNKAITDHCKKTIEVWGNDSLGRQQKMKAIPEGDIYRLITKSQLPSAERFETWVFDEVLPTIRKTGQYVKPKSREEVLADALLVAQQVLQERETQILMLEQVVADYEPKVTYYDLILQCDGAVTISQIAEDYGLTGTRLNKILHEAEVQHKVGGQWLLYRDYKGKGYTKSKTHMTNSNKTVIHTYWTQKGRLLIHDVLSKREIMPLMDIQ